MPQDGFAVAREDKSVTIKAEISADVIP